MLDQLGEILRNTTVETPQACTQCLTPDSAFSLHFRLHVLPQWRRGAGVGGCQWLWGGGTAKMPASACGAGRPLPEGFEVTEAYAWRGAGRLGRTCSFDDFAQRPAAPEVCIDAWHVASIDSRPEANSRAAAPGTTSSTGRTPDVLQPSRLRGEPPS
ncbi:unnamed protein product [Effrenium voratum]|nr:unnamed protein product [Effrenium voratum]